MGQPVVKIALLDLYDNTANQGMRAIRQIIQSFGEQTELTVFDVRAKCEVPDLSFDIYISSGGPGSPLEGNGVWDKAYFEFIDDLFAYNKHNESKKFLFLICHSFQMVCHHLQLGVINKRKSMSFGTSVAHQTQAGMQDMILKDLPNPFYIADFRHWQFVQPNEERFQELGAEILALEKIRPMVDLERAIMSIRFSPEIFGTQFHPEADKDGMLLHFLKDENKEKVVAEHGLDKYHKMIRDLSNPKKIKLTNEVILPTFIGQAIEAVVNNTVNV